MGNHINITATKFPKQGQQLGKAAKLIFHYSNPEIDAVVVRDDIESPFITAFKTEDGRFILATECQWHPV